jgi:hypothetical protein
MLHDYLQVYTVSIVFIGDFNPAIAQPFWLASKKLIREQEAQSALVEVIHDEITKFKLDWLNVEVTRERFELKTSQEPYFEPMKDLAISIFRVLSETPIKALGINHLKYFALTDEKAYYEFGNKLAPLNNWNDFISNPKMMNLEIIESKRKDGLNGSFRIRIQPSDIKLATQYGVLINVNDHYGLENNSKGRNGEMINILGENWQKSVERAENVSEQLWKKISS